MTNEKMKPIRIGDEKTSSNSEADEVLFKRFRSDGDQEAFAELVARHQGRAYRVAAVICPNKLLAEEAVQNAFVQLIRPRCSFSNMGAGAFQAWFTRVATNEAKMLTRSERRGKRREKNPQYRAGAVLRENERAADFDVAQKGLDGEMHAALRRALAELSEDLRLPLLLHYVEGLNQTEISRVTGISQAQVSRRLEKGLSLLRSRLTAGGVSLAVTALPDLLQAATAFVVPAGLKTALLRLGSLSSPPAATASATHAAKGSLFGFSGAAKYVAGVVFFAAIGVPLVLWPTPNTTPQTGSVSAISPETTALFWDFNAPPPESLHGLEVSGNFKWRVVEENGEADGEVYGSGIRIVLPADLPPIPFVLEATLRQDPPDGKTFFRYGCGWLDVDAQKPVPTEELFRRASREYGNPLFSLQYHFTQDDEIICVEGGKVAAVERSKPTRLTNRLALELSGGALTALRVVSPSAARVSRLAELRHELFNVEKAYARSWYLYKYPPDLKGLTLLSGTYEWTRDIKMSGGVGTLYFSAAHELNVLSLPKDCPDELTIKCCIRFQPDNKGVHFGWLNPADGRLYPTKDKARVLDPFVHQLNDGSWHYYEIFLSRKTGFVGYVVDKKAVAYFVMDKIPAAWKTVVNFRGVWADHLSIEAADEGVKEFWNQLRQSAKK